jgi:hypothetical protein
MDKMRKDQHDKFMAQSQEPDNADQVFLLSWTMTLDIAAGINPLDHLTDRATFVNDRLASLDDTEDFKLSPFLWSGTKLPNIVLIDNVKDNKYLGALCLAFNRFHNTCPSS